MTEILDLSRGPVLSALLAVLILGLLVRIAANLFLASRPAGTAGRSPQLLRAEAVFSAGALCLCSGALLAVLPVRYALLLAGLVLIGFGFGLRFKARRAA